MPPRGYRDESKRLERSIEESQKVLAKIGDEDQRQRYKEELARSAEHKARQKAASREEPDLQYLVKIAVLADQNRINPHAAALEIANEIGGNARLRHANQKRLYGKFQKAPALYRRLASASEDPADVADREICQSIGLTPRAEREALYRARLLQWAHEALKQDPLARAIYATRTFKDDEEFVRAYNTVRDILNHFK
jgi:hypothetical protein